MLRLGLTLCIQIALTAWLAMAASPAGAQFLGLGEQGPPRPPRPPQGIPTPRGETIHVPDATEEGLPLQFQRQVVPYRTAETPGTIIVQTSEKFLYVVQPGGRAIRYGIGVGRDGFQWQGLLRISRKQEWPDWTPPPEMLERQPYLPRFMAGGPGNPLGARALYLGATVYRIHGTNEPETIGSEVSSGCFRLVNGDVVDLYERVPIGTKVIVRQQPQL